MNNTVSGIEKGDFYCYEVKSSVDDFHSKNGHNFIGDFNYYVMPAEVYAAVSLEIPYNVGVLVPTDDMWRSLVSVKKAKRTDRKKTCKRDAAYDVPFCGKRKERIGMAVTLHEIMKTNAKVRYSMQTLRGKTLLQWAVLWFKMSNDAFYELYGSISIRTIILCYMRLQEKRYMGGNENERHTF